MNRSSAAPLSAVLQAISSGAGTLEDVGRATGLDRDLVRAGVDHLVRMGRLDARELRVGCPSGGCGTCVSGTPDGSAGCGSAQARPDGRGPLLVALSVRRQPSR